jgi:CDP-glycerol glycerophosphotransferase
MNSSKEIQYKYRTDAEKFKYILSPSAFSSEKFASAWNLNKTGQRNKLIELGYPRDDFMMNYTKEDVTSIKETLKIPEDKKVLLYAPTWRDNQHTSGVGYVYSTEVDFLIMRL